MNHPTRGWEEAIRREEEAADNNDFDEDEEEEVEEEEEADDDDDDDDGGHDFSELLDDDYEEEESDGSVSLIPPPPIVIPPPTAPPVRTATRVAATARRRREEEALAGIRAPRRGAGAPTVAAGATATTTAAAAIGRMNLSAATNTINGGGVTAGGASLYDGKMTIISIRGIPVSQTGYQEEIDVGESEEDEGSGLDAAPSNLVNPLGDAEKREVGDEAAWTLSSAKHGNGAEQIRDRDTSTYWQSDGVHPHTVTITFPRRAELAELAMYLDYHLDESYTPKRVEIRAGNTSDSMKSVIEVELNQPNGWMRIPLNVFSRRRNAPLRAYVLQIRIMAMHQNGRDTHVRHVCVFGPAKRRTGGGDPHLSQQQQQRHHVQNLDSSLIGTSPFTMMMRSRRRRQRSSPIKSSRREDAPTSSSSSNNNNNNNNMSAALFMQQSSFSTTSFASFASLR